MGDNHKWLTPSEAKRFMRDVMKRKRDEVQSEERADQKEHRDDEKIIEVDGFQMTLEDYLWREKYTIVARSALAKLEGDLRRGVVNDVECNDTATPEVTKKIKEYCDNFRKQWKILPASSIMEPQSNYQNGASYELLKRQVLNFHRQDRKNYIPVEEVKFPCHHELVHLFSDIKLMKYLIKSQEFVDSPAERLTKKNLEDLWGQKLHIVAQNQHLDDGSSSNDALPSENDEDNSEDQNEPLATH